MTCRSIQPVSCGAHPTPGLGPFIANLVAKQRYVGDGRIDLQRLRQGLEAATDQGWCLDFKALEENLIAEILRTRGFQLKHIEYL